MSGGDAKSSMGRSFVQVGSNFAIDGAEAEIRKSPIRRLADVAITRIVEFGFGYYVTTLESATPPDLESPQSFNQKERH